MGFGAVLPIGLKNKAKIRIRAIWLKWPEFLALVRKKEKFMIFVLKRSEFDPKIKIILYTD